MSQTALTNPLLDGLPNYETLRDVTNAITYDPLKNVNITNLSLVEKDNLLTGEKVILGPTKKIIMAVMTWYGMLRTGLQNRNPILAENKRRYFRSLATDQALYAPQNYATPGISVNVIKGPTGTGKTVTIQRFCATLPQVIEHGKNEAAGWIFHKQLVYLHINLSHDGSRHGFMYSILLAMDEALGTQYAISLPSKHRTVERLAVATISRLIAHFCGIIFIDESQLRNLVKSGQAELMQLFLLQLINSGIPLVMSGNERAFDWLNYSQDLSRLALTETIHLYPIGALNEPGWQNDWQVVSRSIMKFYLLPEPPPSILACSIMLFECSGGIERLAIILWSQAQRFCLFHQKNFITPEDIKYVYLGPSFSKLKPFADGFRYKNANLLSNYPDVDVSFYKQHWRIRDDDEINAEIHMHSSQEDSIPQKPKRQRTEQAKFKSQQTAEKNKRAQSDLLKKTLAAEDMRIEGMINHNLDQLAMLKEGIES